MIEASVYTFINSTPWWAFAVAVLLFGYFAALILKSIFINIKNARFIDDTPTSKIRSAPQGYVELEGQAHPIPAFQQYSPLTYKPCCWYSYKVEELITYRNGSQTEARWEELITATSPHLFLLKDDTGKCVISPLAAEVVTRKHVNWQDKKLPGHLQKIKASGKRKYRFTESRIETGDPLYVLGHFQTTRSMKTLHNSAEFQVKQQPVSRRANTLRPIFVPPQQEIATTNQEWQQYQQAAQQRELSVNIMRQSPQGNQPFLISNFPQKKLARRYRWRALGYTIFFLFVCAVPFALIAARLQWL